MAAMPAPKKAEHDPALAFALFVAAVPGNRQSIDRAVSMGHRTLGICQGRGAENHVDHAQNGFGVTAHRTRTGGADDQAIRNHKIHRIQHTGVGWHIGEYML